LYQVQERPNLITLIVKTSVNALATMLEAYFNIFGPTHTHTHIYRQKGIALPLLRMCKQDNGQ